MFVNHRQQHYLHLYVSIHVQTISSPSKYFIATFKCSVLSSKNPKPLLHFSHNNPLTFCSVAMINSKLFIVVRGFRIFFVINSTDFTFVILRIKKRIKHFEGYTKSLKSLVMFLTFFTPGSCQPHLTVVSLMIKLVRFFKLFTDTGTRRSYPLVIVYLRSSQPPVLKLDLYALFFLLYKLYNVSVVLS